MTKHKRKIPISPLCIGAGTWKNSEEWNLQNFRASSPTWRRCASCRICSGTSKNFVLFPLYMGVKT